MKLMFSFSVGQIDPFENDMYLIGSYAKTLLKATITQKKM